MITTSVWYEHHSLEILLGSLENLPAQRALVLEMLEKNFAQILLGSIGAQKKSMLDLTLHSGLRGWKNQNWETELRPSA